MKKILFLAALLVTGFAHANGRPRHREIACFQTADGGLYDCNGGRVAEGGGGGSWTSTTTTSNNTTTTTTDNTGGISMAVNVNGGPVSVSATIGSPNQVSTTTTTNSTTTVTTTSSNPDGGV